MFCFLNVIAMASMLLTDYCSRAPFSYFFTSLHFLCPFFHFSSRPGAYDTEGTLGEYLIGRGADDMLENLGLSPYDGIE